KNLVDSQRYIFIAESVSPLGSERRQLTSAYFLQVTKDTITCDLPYFGRAYTASIGVSAGGFQFTSTEFDYKISAGKKKRENVDIKIKDTYDTKQLSLVVFENGYASLNVISNNRQSISYSGYITEIKK
ncbi:MAG: DUF4251 domain-containing protein, partial [Ferruginibacter sp.]